MLAAATTAKAQYMLPRGGSEPAAAAFCPAAEVGDLVPQVVGQDLAAALAQKRKGRALLITGGALSVTGAALFFSSWGMITDATDAGKYFSIGGLSVFAAAIPFYISGSIVYVKGKRAALSAGPGSVALNF